MNIKNNMTRKNLYEWWCNDITSEQRDIIKKFGVSDYSPEREMLDFKKLWYWDDILKRYSYKFPNERMQKLVFFSASWNNNLIIAVSGEGSYGVHLIIYEMPWKSMSEVLETRYIGNYHYLSSVESRISDLESKLNGDSSILYQGSTLKLESYNDYRFKDVQENTLYLPSSSVENNPDNYLKPFDIVKVYTSAFFHTAVYLGNGKVCHARPDSSDTSSGEMYSSSGYSGYSSYGGGGYSSTFNSYSYSNYYGNRTGDSWGWIEITSWENFLKFLGSPSKVVRFHPIVAYKSKDKIAHHLAEALGGAVNYYLKRGKFRVRLDDNGNNNNCEHFANLTTRSIDVSESTEKKKMEKGQGEYSKYYNLESVFNDNNSFFNGLTSSWQSDTISRIESYGNSVEGSHSVMRNGIKMDARIEVTPPYWYRMGRN